MLNLNIKFRDHRVEPLPLGVAIVYCRRMGIGEGAFMHVDSELFQPTTFVADIYDESLSTADADGYTSVSDYAHPEFATRYMNNIEIRSIDKYGTIRDHVDINGYQFLRQPIMWAPWSEVETQVQAIVSQLLK